MNIHTTLSTPLPWLSAVNRLLHGSRGRKQKTGRFILPRTLSFTTEGKQFIAILFIIGIAAINTGNNLLYLIVAMMLSLIVISGLLSESALRGIDLSRTIPRHIFAGKPAICRWSISNTKSFFPSFSISLEETPLAADGGITAESVYIIKIPPNTSLTKLQSYVFQKRGYCRLEGFRIKTRFPFGFFIKGRRVDMPAEVLVYPRLKPVQKIHSSAYTELGSSPYKMRGHGSQLYSLRDYTFRDDSRFIHWKSTAKSLKVMAKEFEQEGKKKVTIVFCNVSAPPHSEEGEKSYNDRFEELVEEAAGMADYFIHCGFEVGFKSMTAELPCKSGKEHLYRIFKELAVIEPVPGDENILLGLRIARQ